MPLTAILGDQRGDTGKGRFVDMLAEDHDIVARFNGGPNAGHTVVLPDGTDFDLHGLPSGVIHPHTTNVIGNGTAVHPLQLYREMQKLATKGVVVNEENLLISSAAHLIMPHHIFEDERREAGIDAQGSTKTGIAPAYSDKAKREGLRVESINHEPNLVYGRVVESLEQANDMLEELNGQRVAEFLDPHRFYDVNAEADLYMKAAEKLGRFSTDTALYLRRKLDAGKRVLAEGAQAFLLDIDHGMYPATTSSSTTIGGVLTGLGVKHTDIERVIGVAKATPSHVGGGPFLTEIHDPELVNKLRGPSGQIDSEFGTTTGRPRRMGYLDLPVLNRASMINGNDTRVLTKLDRVPLYGDKVNICVAYLRKGKLLPIAPDSAWKIEESEPVYEELPNWRADISGVRRFEDLPRNARRFVEFIEEHTGVPITMLGVGPRRDQVIVRD